MPNDQKRMTSKSAGCVALIRNWWVIIGLDLRVGQGDHEKNSYDSPPVVLDNNEL
jgi:hypothetical protein